VNLTSVGVENPSTCPAKWIQLGVTAENQEMADERIPLLLKIPAAVRFVSVEPMLGLVDLHIDWLSPFVEVDASLNRTPRLDWVICGAETGLGARYMDPQWARDLRDQCRATGTPFFFKKMSNRAETPDDLNLKEFPR
jgi:protein gp37